jgi:hypothetical protein
MRTRERATHSQPRPTNPSPTRCVATIPRAQAWLLVISAFVRDRLPDLLIEQWLVMSTFRCLPGSDEAETEPAEVTAVQCY